MGMSIDVVILSYNRKDDLLRNIEGITQSPCWRGEKIYVIDNASSDGTQEELRKLEEKSMKVHATYLDRNSGVCIGRNVGCQQGTSDLILMLDDDAWFDPKYWRSAKKYFEDDPQLGVLAPKVVHAGSGKDQTPNASASEELANYHGAAHVIRRSALEMAGYLDERCIFGGEELDLSMRMRGQGFSVRFAPEIIVLHNSFPRPGKEGNDRRLRWAYSYGLVLGKNLPPRKALAILMRRWLGSFYSYRQKDLPLHVLRLFQATAKGFAEGRKSYTPIGSEAEKFYDNPRLQPEFGNVPLLSKLLGRVIRSG